jgi:phosphoglycolate phosphatase-like HAD superfamily hydrolase
MTTKRAAIFDVDGTLVDTNHLHVVTWWEAFRQAGRHVPMRDIHRAVGLSGGDRLDHLLGDGDGDGDGDGGDRDSDEDEQLTAAHHALYATYFERLPALDAAGDLLRALAGRGWTIVLATSASGAELAALRRAIDADDVILGATSADDVADGKPAPDPVRQARELADVPSGRAVFVGDTVWDMKAAVRDGVVPVAVLSGGIPRADLETAGARAVYQDPADLLAHLDSSAFSALTEQE